MSVIILIPMPMYGTCSGRGNSLSYFLSLDVQLEQLLLSVNTGITPGEAVAQQYLEPRASCVLCT